MPPLVEDESFSNEYRSDHEEETSADEDSTWDFRTWHRRVSITMLLVLILVISMGLKFFNLPMQRIIEIDYCKSYYRRNHPHMIPPHGDIPESLCQIDEVQDKLAWMRKSLDAATLGRGESYSSMCLAFAKFVDRSSNHYPIQLHREST